MTCGFYSILKLFPSRCKRSFEQGVSGIRGISDDPAHPVGDACPKISSFVEISEHRLPSLSPSGSDSFLHGSYKLGKRLYLCRRFLCCRSHVDYLASLILAIALSHQICFRICSGKLFQGLGKNICCQPLPLGQGIPERTVFGDDLVNRDTHVPSGALQSILELLAAHSGVNNRVPVHKAYSACCQRLGKLIHGPRGLGRRRA